MAKTLKNWLYHVVIALDQLGNALADKPKKRWRFWYAFVNGLFFDKNHCKEAYESELERKQYPSDF